MLKKIQEYMTNLYCPEIAIKIVPPLLYSAMLQKWVSMEETMPFRMRMNVMLNWEHGWFKTSLLKQVSKWLPNEAYMLTSSSSAAIRGSYSDGKFFVPELLLADVLIFPEFSSIIEADKETLSQLLVAMEEGDIRVALIKGVKMDEDEIDIIESYGATFEDNRLSYRNDCVIWTATHTLDNINGRLRDALLSRFFMGILLATEIPEEKAWDNFLEKIDIDLEKQFAEWLENIYVKNTMPDFEFAQKVLLKLEKIAKNQRKTPREVGDLRRMALIHHDMMPNESIDVVASQLDVYLDNQGGLTSRDIIANLLFRNPQTFHEIQEATRLSKSNIFNHIKRLGCQKKGRRPTKYYLDSLPDK